MKKILLLMLSLPLSTYPSTPPPDPIMNFFAVVKSSKNNRWYALLDRDYISAKNPSPKFKGIVFFALDGGFNTDKGAKYISGSIKKQIMSALGDPIQSQINGEWDKVWEKDAKIKLFLNLYIGFIKLPSFDVEKVAANTDHYRWWKIGQPDNEIDHRLEKVFIEPKIKNLFREVTGEEMPYMNPPVPFPSHDVDLKNALDKLSQSFKDLTIKIR